MPDKRKYNLGYRPTSYWTLPGDGVVEEQAPTASVAWRTRRTPLLDPTVDFLPKSEGGEVEIACVLLDSVTADIVSIRAQRQGKRIVYSVVDEYNTPFRFQPRRSTRPLSMGELIGLIDGATGHLDGDRQGLTSAYRSYNLDTCAAERLVDFAIVMSDYYPELRAYYAEEATEWLA